jgi:hypothetical protein
MPYLLPTTYYLLLTTDCLLEVVALADARPAEPLRVELGRAQDDERAAARVGLAEVHGEDLVRGRGRG